jgi:hypothetical protein
MLRSVTIVRIDVSEELSASFIRVTRIGELGKLAVTSNRRKLRRNTNYCISSQRASVVTAHIDPSTPIFATDDGGDVLLKYRFLQGSHSVTSRKTPCFLSVVTLCHIF